MLRNQAPQSPSLKSSYAGFNTRLNEFLAQRAERIGSRTFEWVKLHWLGIINFHLFLFISGALVAPIFLYLGQEWMAKVVYGFYCFCCHQKAARSFFIFNNQVAICARCIAFYSAVLVFGLGMSIKKIKPVSFKGAVILIIPVLGDVLLQVLRVRESTNLIRVTTGVLSGLAVSLYLIPRAQEGMRRLET